MNLLITLIIIDICWMQISVKMDLPYSERTNDLQIAGQWELLGIFIMRLSWGDWVDWFKLRFSVGNPGNQNFCL